MNSLFHSVRDWRRRYHVTVSMRLAQSRRSKRACKYLLAHILLVNQQLIYSQLHHAIIFVTIDNIIKFVVRDWRRRYHVTISIRLAQSRRSKRACKYLLVHILLVNQQLIYSQLHHAIIFVTIDSIIYRSVFSSSYLQVTANSSIL